VDRRGFFKQVLGKGLDHGARHVDAVVIPFERAAAAAKAAMPEEETAAALEDAFAPVDDSLASTAAGDAAARTPLPAAPVAAPCAIEDVMRLAADAGLVTRVEAVCALARETVRFVLADDDPDSVAAPAARSRFGGAPDIPADVAWPRWRDEPLTFLAQIDLAEVAATGLTDGALPAEGLLLVFSAADAAPSGQRPADFGSTRVLLVDSAAASAAASAALSAPAGPFLPAAPRPLSLSVEWTIPPVGSATVQSLRLDEQETAAWEQVRTQLAELHGVELQDAGGELHALHRLLGQPDERQERMQLACEFAARGVDLGERDRATHPRAAEYAVTSSRWRLLAQLTIDDELGWRWGAGRERLSLWIDEQDLAARVFAGVRATAQ
jgi:uncharacterized protein YwqG